MKKERTIVIKNPLLRNLRNNLRDILIEAIWEKVEILNEKIKQFKPLADIPKDERSPLLDLMGQKEDLNKLRVNSIAYCQLCTSHHNNMVYIPENEAWYCTECQKKGVIVRLKDTHEDHIVP